MDLTPFPAGRGEMIRAMVWCAQVVQANRRGSLSYARLGGGGFKHWKLGEGNTKLNTKFYRLLIFLAVLLALPLPRLGHAQEDGGLSAQEQEWLVYLQAAFHKYSVASSFHIEGEQLTTQTLTTSPALGSAEIRTSLDQKFATDVQLDGAGRMLASSGDLDQTSVVTGLGQETRQVMVMETVVVDGDFYVVVPNYEDSNGTPNPFPTEWINLREDASQFPGLQYFDIEGLMDYSSRILPFGELSDTLLRSITEGGSMMVDDQHVFVYTLEYDMAAISAMGAAGLGSIYSEEMATTMGLNGDELVHQMFDGATMYQTVWIDADRQVPRRIKSQLHIDADIFSPAIGDTLHIAQTTISVQDISNYDDPVTIEAPIQE